MNTLLWNFFHMNILTKKGASSYAIIKSRIITSGNINGSDTLSSKVPALHIPMILLVAVSMLSILSLNNSAIHIINCEISSLLTNIQRIIIPLTSLDCIIKLFQQSANMLIRLGMVIIRISCNLNFILLRAIRLDPDYL